MLPKTRKQEILTAALKVCRDHGFNALTADNVALQACISRALIHAYWGKMDSFKDAVMREAVRVEDYKVVAEGIVLGNKVARKVSAEVRRQAIAQL